MSPMARRIGSFVLLLLLAGAAYYFQGRSEGGSDPSFTGAPTSPDIAGTAPPEKGPTAERRPEQPPEAAESVRSKEKPAKKPPAISRPNVGFTSRASLQTHFEKHGSEFDVKSSAEYLKLAQVLRDAPLSAAVLERVRRDGVITRFDKKTGSFVAFHDDGSIRTFFRPNDGEAYFRRQAERDG